MTQTFLTTSELSEKIKYDCRTIREQLKDSVLLEGVHNEFKKILVPI